MGSDKTNPMMLTDKLREELTAFLTASIEKRCTVYPIAKQRQLEALRDQIALASLMAEPKAYTDIEELSFKNSMSDIWPTPLGSGRDVPLFTAPPVQEVCALTQIEREELIALIESSLPIMRSQVQLPYANKDVAKHIKIYEVAYGLLITKRVVNEES